MDFGKLSDISGVTFEIPADATETAAALAKAKSTAVSNNIYIGCTGWVMKEWCKPPNWPSTSCRSSTVAWV